MIKMISHAPSLTEWQKCIASNTLQ